MKKFHFFRESLASDPATQVIFQFFAFVFFLSAASPIMYAASTPNKDYTALPDDWLHSAYISRQEIWEPVVARTFILVIQDGTLLIGQDCKEILSPPSFGIVEEENWEGRLTIATLNRYRKSHAFGGGFGGANFLEIQGNEHSIKFCGVANQVHPSLVVMSRDMYCANLTMRDLSSVASLAHLASFLNAIEASAMGTIHGRFASQDGFIGFVNSPFVKESLAVVLDSAHRYPPRSLSRS